MRVHDATQCYATKRLRGFADAASQNVTVNSAHAREPSAVMTLGAQRLCIMVSKTDPALRSRAFGAFLAFLIKQKMQFSSFPDAMGSGRVTDLG